MSYFSSVKMNFSGLKFGAFGGVTTLLNSLAGASVSFVINALAVPSYFTSTVTSAFILS